MRGDAEPLGGEQRRNHRVRAHLDQADQVRSQRGTSCIPGVIEQGGIIGADEGVAVLADRRTHEGKLAQTSHALDQQRQHEDEATVASSGHDPEFGACGQIMVGPVPEPVELYEQVIAASGALEQGRPLGLQSVKPGARPNHVEDHT